MADDLLYTEKPEDFLFEVKITLKDVVGEPSRTIIVPDITLLTLHDLIQDLFAWDDYHLWNFEFRRDLYFGPVPDNDRADYCEWEDADEFALGDALINGFRRFRYIYDFGDNWVHTINLRKATKAACKAVEGRPLPVCIAAQGAAPPEDCGGVWGYADLVEGSNNKEFDPDGDMAERLEHYGIKGPIDVNACDLDKINENLGELEATFKAIDKSSDAGQALISDAFFDACDQAFERVRGGDYDVQFLNLCRAVLVLAVGEGVDLTSGKPEGWAAGAVNVVASTNMLVHPYRGEFPTLSEVGKACGVSLATLQNRARELREALNVFERGDPRFVMPEAVRKNFMLWGAVARNISSLTGRPADEAFDILGDAFTAPGMLQEKLLEMLTRKS